MYVKETTSVVQANYLVENRPLFTKDETRLFLTIVATVNKDDEDFKPMQIPVKDFADLWGVDPKNAYQQIKAALRGLRNKEFYIEGVNPDTGKRRFISSSSISTAVYEEGEGYATVEISKLFKPYLLDLKAQYTSYVLQNIMDLTTVNAIRNYEILKQYQKAGKRTMTFQEYKQMLKIEDKYPDNTDLRRYVIEPSIQEINEKTDIHVTCEYGGRGKKAYAEFTIAENKPKQRVKRTIVVKPERAEDNREPEQLDIDTQEMPATISREEIARQERLGYYRTALRDPSLITDAQLEECIALAKESRWCASLLSRHLLDEIEHMLYGYIKRQDMYTHSNYTDSFYGFFRMACAENYAGVAGYDDEDEEPDPKKKERRSSSFETSDFFAAAVKKSMGEDFDSEILTQ